MKLPFPIRVRYTPYWHAAFSAYRVIRVYVLSNRGRWLPVAFVVYAPHDLGAIFVRKKYRRRGVGEFLLRCVLHEADAKGWRLMLEVSESYGSDEDSLIRWYRRFGFRVKYRPSLGQRLVHGALTEMTRSAR